jgi:small subunit ribosomal protein S1
VPGKVKRLEPFGAFVEIAPGIEGLVHVSRITLDKRISHPRQALTADSDVEVTVVSIEADKRRIGLSMVESARRARDGAELAESRETSELLAKSQGAKSLGTFAELLSTRKQAKPGK